MIFMPRPIEAPLRQSRIWLNFTIQMGLIICIFIVGLYMGVYLRDSRLIENQIHTRAQAHFRNIVLTRLWNAMQGGVYVEKKQGVKSNPYLEDPDVRTEDGRTFTLRNPALMTREISELAEKDGLLQYRITSLRPLNPANAPDSFEKQALQLFEQGETEYATRETRNGKTFYRYMAPLFVDSSCMKCHARQGYKIGDVRGGISVAFDITPIQTRMASDRNVMIGIIAASAALILGVLMFFTLRIVHQMGSARDRLTTLALTDELTGLYNRRHFFTRLDEEIEHAKRYGTPLSLMLTDVDHFRKINDIHGHMAGDRILSQFARLMRMTLRSADILVRYEGGTFAVIFPATDRKGAIAAAEKFRTTVAAYGFLLDDRHVSLTTSCGVATLRSTEGETGDIRDRLIRTAEEKLHQAKDEGRDRVRH